MSNKNQTIWQAGIEALLQTTPIVGPATVAMMRAAREAEEVLGKGDLNALEDETKRQTLELRMAEMQAQVAQEIAIAHRIQTAEEVEIEEYYASEAEGSAGAKADDKGLTLGLSGKGREVTKRVFRFKGFGDSK